MYEKGSVAIKSAILPDPGEITIFAPRFRSTAAAAHVTMLGLLCLSCLQRIQSMLDQQHFVNSTRPSAVQLMHVMLTEGLRMTPPVPGEGCLLTPARASYQFTNGRLETTQFTNGNRLAGARACSCNVGEKVLVEV